MNHVQRCSGPVNLTKETRKYVQIEEREKENGEREKKKGKLVALSLHLAIINIVSLV